MKNVYVINKISIETRMPRAATSLESRLHDEAVRGQCDVFVTSFLIPLVEQILIFLAFTGNSFYGSPHQPSWT